MVSNFAEPNAIRIQEVVPIFTMRHLGYRAFCGILLFAIAADVYRTSTLAPKNAAAWPRVIGSFGQKRSGEEEQPAKTPFWYKA